MIEFENTETIARPLDEVFEFVSDPENFPKWNYFVTSVSPITPGERRQGTRYLQVRKSDRQELQISALEPNRRVRIETIPPSQPEVRREMEFRGDEERTSIVDKWEMETGRPTFLERLARSRIKSAVRANLGKLRILLETGSVRLQDGRLVELDDSNASSAPESVSTGRYGS
jgi:uncharacterized protein YndB with AHSA1/START domain